MFDTSADRNGEGIGVITLHHALQEVLPTTLVSSTEEASEVVSNKPSPSDAANTFLQIFAAALGSTAVGPLASALVAWLDKRRYQVRALPRWLKPALTTDAQPVLATLTEFSNQRSMYVRQAVDEQIPVLLTRHGRVVAAVIPVEKGAFEESTYPIAADDIRAERLAGRSNLQATLETLTEEEIHQIRTSDDPVQTAASLGVDLHDESATDAWHEDYWDGEKRGNT